MMMVYDWELPPAQYWYNQSELTNQFVPLCGGVSVIYYAKSRLLGQSNNDYTVFNT